MGAQEATGKIFNSRTLPKPVLPGDSLGSSNHHHIAAAPPTATVGSGFNPRIFGNYPSSSGPVGRRLADGSSFDLPKVKREPSPEDPFQRSAQLALAPLRSNGSSPTLLGLASVCSSRSPLPSTDSESGTTTTTTTLHSRHTIKSRPYSPPPSPYPKRRTSSSSENMDYPRTSNGNVNGNNGYSSPRLGGVGSREYDQHRSRRGAYELYDPTGTRQRSGSGSTTSASASASHPDPNSINTRPSGPMLVDSPTPNHAHPVAPQAPSRVQMNGNGVSSTDRMWATYRPRGAPSLSASLNRLPPLSSHHTSPPNLGIAPGGPGGVPSHTHKRPSPSNAGESEKEDMDEDGDELGRAGLNGSMSQSGAGLSGKEDDSFTSHREKRRVIEKKSRMRRVDALDHLRLVVSREYQNQHQRAHAAALAAGGNGPVPPLPPSSLSALHNIDPLTQAPRKNCQADICFEAVEIIEKLRSENDRLRIQNRELIERLQSGSHGSASARSV